MRMRGVYIILNLINVLLLSAIIYLVIVFISLIYRRERGALTFALLMFASSIYSVAYYFELHSQNIEMLWLYLRLEYLGTIFIAPLWLIFVLKYTGRAKSLTLSLILFLFLIPCITLFLMNSQWHYWVYPSMSLLFIEDISIAVLERGFWYWIYIINFNVMVLVGNLLLLHCYVKSLEVYKNRYLLLFIGSLFPWIALLIHIFNNNLINIDLAPFGLTFAGFIFLYNLLNFNLFDFMSLARKEIFELTHDGLIVFDTQYNIVDYNSAAASILDGLEEDGIGRNIYTALGKYNALVQAMLTNKNAEMEIYNSGKNNYYNVTPSKIYNRKSQVIGFIATLVDNTRNVEVMKAIKANETELIESEKKYRLLITQMQQGLAIHELICDATGQAVDYRFIDVNASYEHLTGLKRENIIGRTVLEVMPETETYWIEKFAHVVVTGEPLHYENYSRALGRYYQVIAYSLHAQQFAVILIDITERKEKQKKIEYLSYHDQLTGLYNRRFFKEELHRQDTIINMPLTLVMADINGLKLTNDAFGHLYGDKLLQKAAAIMTRECRADDIISRIGGDEFVLLFPKTDSREAENIVKRMRKAIAGERLDSIVLSISFGWDTKIRVDEDMNTILKKAEDRMYRRKLSESSSMRNKTIKVIIKTLYEKNKREEQHSVRVGQLCKDLGAALGLGMEDLSELQTVGLMHDIGKITLEERLLDKPGKLNDAEWIETKRHSETGYRILSSVNEFSQLAEYVLAHHERWDGKGYPKGLKGEEIPLEARIIAIADAYDAMTCDRPYRKALDKNKAIEEIKRHAGTQFDPRIAMVFIEKVLL